MNRAAPAPSVDRGIDHRAPVAAPTDLSGSAEASWSSALDDLEALIAHQRHVLEAGGPSDPAALAGLFFAPPDDLPPLPPSLEERAGLLLTQTRALIERAREMADAVEPAGHSVHQPVARRAAATFDARA